MFVGAFFIIARWAKGAQIFDQFICMGPIRQSRAEGPSFDKNAAHLGPDSETAWRYFCQKSSFILWLQFLHMYEWPLS